MDTSPHGHRHGMHGRAWGRDEALAILEFPGRHLTQDPVALWRRVGLTPGATVVEIGAGTGYFALPAARQVGPTGHVYAVDLSPELVALLQERADSEGLRQFEAIRNTEEAIPLASAVADVVLLANVLHDIPPSTLRESVRLMKADGRLVNVDWKKEETDGGPPLHVRLSPGDAAGRLRGQGLRVVEEWEFGPYHYALTCRRAATAATTA